MIDVVIRAIAGDIVASVLRDLTGRGGLQETWDSIDEETQLEIKEEWTEIAFQCLKKDLEYMVRRERKYEDID